MLEVALVSALLIARAAFPLDAPDYRDKMNLMVYQPVPGTFRPVLTFADWRIRREHILANMQQAMGAIPGVERRGPMDLQITSEEDRGKYVLKHATLAVEQDDRLPVLILIPKGLTKPAPAMLCLHQTTSIGKGEPGGLGGLDNLHYAQELAERGYVCIAPDYPNFGDYQIDVYAKGYGSATAKGIFNHMRCVDYLQTMPEVNAERIGAIGHSLGGHNTLYVGAFDERLKVLVSSCGFNRFAKYYNGDLTGWSHKGYMPRIKELYETNPAKMPFDFTEVIAAIAPRAVFVNAPVKDANFEVTGVYDCVRAALPVFQQFHAGKELVSVHPDCEHDFPPAVREQAYAFIDQHLK